MEFQTAIFVRKYLSNLLDELTLEQLNTIPKGYNNNILWNIAHVLVTEQMLTYGLCDLPIAMDAAFISQFKKGSKCFSDYTYNELQLIKNDYFKLINKTQYDYGNNRFKNFKEYPTSTGISLKSIGDALRFNSLHEGIHLGVVLSLKKLV